MSTRFRLFWPAMMIAALLGGAGGTAAVAAPLPPDEPEVVDAFIPHDAITTSEGLRYVPFDRTYRGIPVVGGDFVVVTDASGRVRSTSGQQQRPISVATNPKLTTKQAETVARGQLDTVDRVESTRLVVDASDTVRLAYESVVVGTRDRGDSRLHVFVDAQTGEVLRGKDEVVAGTGTGKWNGPNPLTIGTSGSAGSYSMTDPNRSGLKCGNNDNQQIYTDPDDNWGDGVGTNKVTGCVDALFVAGKEWDMLRDWLGRNGINGNGSGYPIYMGDPLGQNAHWTGSAMTVGYNSRNEWISSLDVVGHEFGHAIDQFTPGGTSANEAQEFVADVFGAATEAYASEPSPYDTPDYLVGETINLQGNGPIRNMYNPSLVNSDPNCYSSTVPNMEVHKAAGPGNHWFYLLAEGSNPGGGKPASPTCNSSTVTGIGVQNALRVFYNALLRKTSGMTYLRYRTATLQAAKDLDRTCAQFTATKAAWDAVSVPAQTGDPTCTPDGGGGGNPPNVDLAAVKADLSQLNTIASNNGGNRRAGSNGHTQSVDYLENKLRGAGFTTSRQRCTSCTYPSDNLIADWPGGDESQVYMFGAHLDSVSAGPGINDNGSGSAAVLEAALALADAHPTMTKHVRFGWWTDEEQGLNGSRFYVNSLSTTDNARIKGYLNFDMVGSPNAGYFINNISTELAGSLKGYFDSISVQTEENTEGANRSDDASFRNGGIATSGTAAGANATKSAAQAQKWGGTANQPFDSCYHQACDTSANINDTALDRNADAVAYAIWRLTVGSGPPGGSITNGGFEAGNLSGWTPSGTTGVVSTGAHSGSYAARLGSTAATNGVSSVEQTFTVPAGASQLSFWYSVSCPDTVFYAWAKVTLRDNTGGTISTPLAKTCTNGEGWKQVSVPVTGGRSYTLTLVNRDDNYPDDPVYTLFDDVSVG